ncbi:actin [Tritrichomonas foetus]|uniref:Actin n=1 Tax=Tritrichomonas foetus TaxID=1144522 RepID=A0A1J4JK63_9EUKA|nr:actin [Tritrichomonas foetus]|eukprot:OHS97923.1 actin [Tritrichomonas foetus]
MEVSTVVLDNGSYLLRAGMSGYSKPSVLIPTVIARSNTPKVKGDLFAPKDIYIGSDVFTCEVPNLDISYPIKERAITNYGQMEKIWNYIFSDELIIKPEEHPIVLTEAPFTPERNRQQAIQIMMEKFSFAAYYSSIPEVFSLFSAGRTTGLVVDSGESMTDILPVFECYPMYHVFSRLPIGGSHINSYLKRLLMQSGIEINESNENQLLNDIKEKLCYVPIDIEEEQHKYEHVNEIEKTYQMPSGLQVHIGSQRFRCVEPLFDPRLIQIQSEGINQLLFETINKCGELKQEMFKNIVLSGGTSLFPGFGQRLKKDLSKLAPPETKIDVIANEDRSNAAWLGGSVLASQASFSLMWITKDEYQEVGDNIVNLKCF